MPGSASPANKRKYKNTYSEEGQNWQLLCNSYRRNRNAYKSKIGIIPKPIGIDRGLESFITLSNGVKKDNPRFLRNSEERLKLFQRRMARKEKGSGGRQKSIRQLAKLHVKIYNQRSDFLHKISKNLSEEYTLFALEKLNINSMIKGHRFAKSIKDASWGRFLQLLSYKAESANLKVVLVNPKNTSKVCSKCGNIRHIELSNRVYDCKLCGLLMDRDINAAVNILKKATAGLAESHACVWGDISNTFPKGDARYFEETGTKHDEIISIDDEKPTTSVAGGGH